MVTSKKKALEAVIRDCGSLLVSYSGGVDSTLLAVVAHEILGDRSRAVFLDSPLVPWAARDDAIQTAEELGIGLDVIPVPHMDHPDFVRNTPDRCYFCKKISARYLKEQAAIHHLRCIADGANTSDLGEHRPGLVAADEEGILHPFILAGISKPDIREISREMGIRVWQKPSAACLSSRIPYGDAITPSALRTIEECEAFLAGKGFGQFRVRLHGNLARIELQEQDFDRLLANRAEILRFFHDHGISYITLDLGGYRSGSMDEVL